MTDLVGTPAGKAWIEQFDPSDRDLARTLLSSLTLVSHNIFRAKIHEHIERVAADIKEPIALYAVREIDKKLPYFENKRNRPSPVKPRTKVGSEGEMSTLITGLERLNSAAYLNHPPLQTLRKQRCHHIVLLDDLSGSGGQVADFIENFYRHKTIKSWCSYHLLTFHIVAFAISEEAEKTIKAALRVSNKGHLAAGAKFHYSHRSTPGGLVWTKDLRNQIIRLCKTYGKRCLAKWEYHLGYNSTMATIVFAHGCPNNTPAILWNVSSKWHPLFPNRAIPSLLLPTFEDVNWSTDRSNQLKSLQSVEPGTYEPMSPTGLNIMLVLAATKRKVRRMDRMSQATCLPVPTCKQVIDECKRLGFLDDSAHLTTQGINHLQYAARSGRLPDVTPPLKNDFYFPKSLRATKEAG